MGIRTSKTRLRMSNNLGPLTRLSEKNFKPCLEKIVIAIPETSSILANMGGRGNSAICRPSGDVRLPLSSRAELNRYKIDL